ncbi:MAG: AbrB/MazE/SpoVT family DNA-binding domain-containing protein [Deltaproteobacteria bacterium]|nr:AbrB/MazE/SpoVT family DNA-binding domain-containing protein [Deltaproteobacteria bacterium]
MRIQIQKWGNSLALRIPKAFAEDTGVEEGTAVDLSISKGKLVAIPAKRRKLSLRQLLSRVNKLNLHGEVDSGPPVGREVW